MEKNYNPFKATVESIMEMCEKYAAFKDERANDFLNNIRVKCKDALEYEKLFKEPKFSVGDKIIEDNEFGIVGGEIINIDTTHYELANGRFIPISQQDYFKLVETPMDEALVDEIHDRWEDDPHTKWSKCPYSDFKNIAVHFANWQKQQIMKNAINAEIVEVEDVSYSMNAHTHLEISTDEDLEKNYKDGDKLKLIIVKENKKL